jgi:peptidoglycan hydrolase-like protein with peptidoglycan-binding domain
MEIVYPLAQWRPLATPDTEPVIGTPRVFIVHTMVGNLAGTDRMFRQGGYAGTEATFGIGGPWEAPSLDGVVYQWQEIVHQADAQWDGNGYATSVETADGGNPNNPWTAQQMAALVSLGVWWCRQTGNPAVLVKTVADKGFGYHRQFPQWNHSGHSCPGDVRLRQYTHDVVPGIADRLSTPSLPPTTAYVLKRYLRLADPMLHGDDVKRCQSKVGVSVDGYFGKVTRQHVTTYQAAHRLVADGVVGPATAHAFGWRWAG